MNQFGIGQIVWQNRYPAFMLWLHNVGQRRRTRLDCYESLSQLRVDLPDWSADANLM